MGREEGGAAVWVLRARSMYPDEGRERVRGGYGGGRQPLLDQLSAGSSLSLPSHTLHTVVYAVAIVHPEISLLFRALAQEPLGFLNSWLHPSPLWGYQNILHCLRFCCSRSRPRIRDGSISGHCADSIPEVGGEERPCVLGQLA